jgi:hypothetical protein
VRQLEDQLEQAQCEKESSVCNDTIFLPCAHDAAGFGCAANF